MSIAPRSCAVAISFRTRVCAVAGPEDLRYPLAEIMDEILENGVLEHPALCAKAWWMAPCWPVCFLPRCTAGFPTEIVVLSEPVWGTFFGWSPEEKRMYESNVKATSLWSRLRGNHFRAMVRPLAGSDLFASLPNRSLLFNAVSLASSDAREFFDTAAPIPAFVGMTIMAERLLRWSPCSLLAMTRKSAGLVLC